MCMLWYNNMRIFHWLYWNLSFRFDCRRPNSYVNGSVRLSAVRPFVRLSHVFHYVRIIVWSWNFQELLPLTELSDVLAKGTSQRSNVKVIEGKTQFSRFQTVTPAWIHIRRRNDVRSLMLHMKGTLLFFKVIRQISRSHGTNNPQFWTRLGVSGLWLQFEFNDGYGMMHKAWSII